MEADLAVERRVTNQFFSSAESLKLNLCSFGAFWDTKTLVLATCPPVTKEHEETGCRSFW